MTEQEISDLHQEKQSKIFESHGAFWAFGPVQFDEQKKEGVEYDEISLFPGLCIPKENRDALIAELAELGRETKRLKHEHIGMDTYIQNELLNNEAYFTEDLWETLGNVQSAYPKCTMADIERVYQKNKGE